MKLVLCLTLCFLVAGVSPLLLNCNPNCGITCPSGEICKFNGCGFSCQSLFIGKRACQFVACDLYCPFGFQTANGCTLCSCKPNPLIGLLG